MYETLKMHEICPNPEAAELARPLSHDRESPAEAIPNDARYNDAKHTHESLMQTVFNVFLSGPAMQSLEATRIDSSGRARKFGYGYLAGKPGHALVVMIPGFGCPPEERTARYLSQHLNSRGYHVVTMHSPSSEHFLVHSHHSGIPGITTEDTRDALMGISAIRDQLCERGAQYNKVHLIGYSMGALNAAFARLQDRQGQNLFTRVILINPPLNLAYGMSQLDSFLEANRMSTLARAKIIAKVGLFIVAFGSLRMRHARRSKLFLASSVWSERELRALIGFGFRKTVRGGVTAALKLGHLKRRHKIKTFTQYCETATVSHYQNFKPGATSRDLFHHESFRKIAPALAADDSVRILHNQNDFLLTEGDVSWLEREFGQRAHIFGWGGHLGNIWHSDFHARLDAAIEAPL